MFCKRAWKSGLLLLLSSAGFGAMGVQGAALPNLSPAMIEQLKALPPSQARALAQQYGIDVDSVLGGSRSQEPAPGQLPPFGAQPSGLQSLMDPELLQQLGVQEASRDEDELEDATESLDTIEPLDPSKRFGLDFFSTDVSTFAPVDNAPVPQDYRLGPGDELQVLLLGQSSGELTLTIDRLGQVFFPEIGSITLAGLTVEAGTTLLQERVASARIGVQALVSMGRLRAINVMLAGEVEVPGARSLSAMARVSQALFASGGVSDIGSLRQISVKRGGELVGQFDAYDLLLRGDASNDVPLRDGDVVFVPPVAALAGVSGAVRRPGVFELKEGENLGDLVAMAGGLTARGRAGEILIEREEVGGAPKIFRAQLDELEAMLGRPGDRLRIQVAAQRFANRVELRGAAQRPGVYGHFEGMRLSDFLRDPDVDVLEITDLGYGVVVSADRFSGEISVRQFSPQKVFSAADSKENLLLRPRDSVYLFSRPGASDALSDQLDLTNQEFGALEDLLDEERAGNRPAPTLRRQETLGEPRSIARSQAGSLVPGASVRDRRLEALRVQEAKASSSSRQTLLAPVIAQLARQATPTEPVKTVQIEGAVQAPGTYPLGEAYSVADLVSAAGGFRDDAYLEQIEVQRVVVDEASIAGIRTFTIQESQSSSGGFQLKSRDRVAVRAIPNWQPKDTITLEGEFRFPGEYTLIPGETLGALIDRAGGITPRAFPYGAVYTAQAAAETERDETERFANEIRRSYASMTLTQQEQRATFQELNEAIQAILDRESLGRIAIDLPRILAGDQSADLVVADGDKIYLPKRNDTITVLGEVFRPGSFRFEQGLDLRDYLALGAGATPRGDEGSIYVVRANGRVDRPGADWLNFRLAGTRINPGDTIVVPVNASYRDPLDFWTSITQVAYQTGIAIAAVLRN